MVELGRSNKSSTATGARRGASPLSSDGSRLTISRRRLARIRNVSGWDSVSNAEGSITAGEIGGDVLDVVDIAKHGNIADQLTAVGDRGRENADRPDPLHGAAFDAAQGK